VISNAFCPTDTRSSGAVNCVLSADIAGDGSNSVIVGRDDGYVCACALKLHQWVCVCVCVRVCVRYCSSPVTVALLLVSCSRLDVYGIGGTSLSLSGDSTSLLYTRDLAESITSMETGASDLRSWLS